VASSLHAQQLQKRGTYSGKFAFFDDNGTATTIDKDRLIWHAIGQGLFFNDAGSGFLHEAIVVCPGRGLIDKGVVSFSGYCTATDKDGDNAVLEWRCEKSSGRREVISSARRPWLALPRRFQRGCRPCAKPSATQERFRSMLCET
jgi:hypothetical protein